MVQLSEKYTNNIRLAHRKIGEDWLLKLNDLIAYCENRWSFKVLETYDLSFNFVAPVRFTGGKEAVLKLSVVSEEFYFELEALKHFNNLNGNFVKLLDFDKEKGIILLEQLTPGNMLATLEDDILATKIAVKVINELWNPVESDHVSFPTTRNRENSLKKIIKNNPTGLGPISIQSLNEAANIFKKMNETEGKRYLLHGDLHHYNILSSNDDSWKIIDPKGLIGEREYDLIQFLMNRLPSENVTERIEKRIDIFVEELGLNKERILLWGICHSILSNAWAVNDEGKIDDEPFFQTINVFQKLYHKWVNNHN